MKLQILLASLLLFFHSCVAQKNTDLILNYEAFTRGNSLQIEVTAKELIFINLDGEKRYNLKAAHWNTIQQSIAKIDLNAINDLEAPSTKSHVDAALIASLKVTKDYKTYKSSTFDHGNPPKELKELLDLLFSITEINE